MACAVVLLITACSKEVEGPASALRASGIIAIDIPDVLHVIDLRAGDGVVLMTYIDNNDFYHFILLENNGDTLWTRPFKSRMTGTTGIVSRPINVLAMPDGGFGVIYENGLYTIDLDGTISTQPQVLFDNLQTWQSGTHFRVLDNGNFLLAGQIALGGNRGYIAEYSQNGSMLYRHTLLINVSSATIYTSSIQLPDGSFLFAGSFTSPVANLNNAYFVSKLSEGGELLWTKIHDTDPFEAGGVFTNQNTTYPGRNMLPLSDGTFVYLLNPRGAIFSDQRMRLVYFDADGEATRPHTFINHAEINTTNYSLGVDRPAMALNEDGSITGLATTSHPAVIGNSFLAPPLSYRAPQRSFFFDLDLQGQPQRTADVDRNFSNSFTSIARLSDGRTMIAGTKLAMGVDLKIMCIYR